MIIGTRDAHTTVTDSSVNWEFFSEQLMNILNMTKTVDDSADTVVFLLRYP